MTIPAHDEFIRAVRSARKNERWAQDMTESQGWRMECWAWAAQRWHQAAFWTQNGSARRKCQGRAHDCKQVSSAMFYRNCKPSPVPCADR